MKVRTHHVALVLLVALLLCPFVYFGMHLVTRERVNAWLDDSRGESATRATVERAFRDFRKTIIDQSDAPLAVQYRVQQQMDAVEIVKYEKWGVRFDAAYQIDGRTIIVYPTFE